MHIRNEYTQEHAHAGEKLTHDAGKEMRYNFILIRRLNFRC